MQVDRASLRVRESISFCQTWLARSLILLASMRKQPLVDGRVFVRSAIEAACGPHAAPGSVFVLALRLYLRVSSTREASVDLHIESSLGFDATCHPGEKRSLPSALFASPYHSPGMLKHASTHSYSSFNRYRASCSIFSSPFPFSLGHFFRLQSHEYQLELESFNDGPDSRNQHRPRGC